MVRLFLRPSAIEPSHIFILFYTVALVTDFDDRIGGLSAAIIIILSLWVALTVTRLSFLALLFASTVYFVFWELPDTENHTNFLIISNITIMFALLYSYTLSAFGDERRFYEIVQPVARLLIVCGLAAAGLHKLNYDFIDPSVSCIGIFVDTISNVILRSDFASVGIAPIVFLGLMAIFIAFLLWRQRPLLCRPPIDWSGIATPVAVIILGALVLGFVGGDVESYSWAQLGIFVVAVAVLTWQLIEAPLLLIPRFQWVALVFSLVVHFQLALMRIVDFQAASIALLITFVPPHVWVAWSRQAFVSLGAVRLHRAHVYYLLNLAGMAIIAAQYQGLIDWQRPLTAWGLLFVAGVLVMLWPIISDLCSPTRDWEWRGVPVLNAATPRLLYVMPVLLLLFGLTSYFGLRTAGNMSMYSNLRTEAGQNNHLFLPSNPLQWANYQDDVVHILDLGDDAEISPDLDRWGALEGNLLPIVEFRKLLWIWRVYDKTVPMTVVYDGVVTTSANIAEHPDWRVEHWDWAMRLQDFRVIQTAEGPNECRW